MSYIPYNPRTGEASATITCCGSYSYRTERLFFSAMDEGGYYAAEIKSETVNGKIDDVELTIWDGAWCEVKHRIYRQHFKSQRNAESALHAFNPFLRWYADPQKEYGRSVY